MQAVVRDARLNGVKHAVRVSRMFEVRERIDATDGQIDVFDTLAQLDVHVVFKPLVGLLGAFIPSATPGVIINTRRRLPIQRFTAAHELGHATMSHEPSLDSEGVLRRAALTEQKGRLSCQQLQEVEADAFASEFITPRWLIAYHARIQGWSASELSRPSVAYQLSLRMGSSFEATIRSLERHKLLSGLAASRMLLVKPKDIKSKLRGEIELSNPWADAWSFSRADLLRRYKVPAGDLIELRLHNEASHLVVDGNSVIRKASPQFFEAVQPGLSRIMVTLPGESGDASLEIEVVAPEKGLSRANRLRFIVAL